MARKKDPVRPAAEESTFLTRWSRRKQAAREQHSDQPPAETTDPAGAEDAAATSRSEAPTAERAPEGAPPSESGAQARDAGGRQAIDDDDLAPPESLDADSDFSAYLSERVSSGMRRAAMRKLFSLPGFNVRDGLDDYDEDYTNFAKLGETVTADMKYHAERLRARREEAEERKRAANTDDTVPASPSGESQADQGPPDAPSEPDVASRSNDDASHTPQRDDDHDDT